MANYIRIGNFDSKTIRQSQIQSVTLFLGIIFIIHKRSKDRDSKYMDLKAKFQYLALKTKLQRKYYSSTGNWLDTIKIQGSTSRYI